MKLGATLRSMGPQSTRETLLACTRAAEAAGLDDVWVQDHIAIPPDDAEGSEGRYLDPLTTLAWLAGATERIGLGTGVLILPYRPPLPTAKVIATLQELSGGRLRLGVGVGWMQPEFDALGVARSERGRLSDEALAFFGRCFANDVVESHGQPFLFKPRPAQPPIYVGGAAPHALERAVRYGDGWMPMARDASKLGPEIQQLRELAESAGRPAPAVVVMTGFSLADPERAAAQLRDLEAIGVSHIVYGSRYADADEFRKHVEGLERVLAAL